MLSASAVKFALLFESIVTVGTCSGSATELQTSCRTFTGGLLHLYTRKFWYHRLLTNTASWLWEGGGGRGGEGEKGERGGGGGMGVPM